MNSRGAENGAMNGTTSVGASSTGARFSTEDSTGVKRTTRERTVERRAVDKRRRRLTRGPHHVAFREEVAMSTLAEKDKATARKKGLYAGVAAAGTVALGVAVSPVLGIIA